jgi:hypothetical protein
MTARQKRIVAILAIADVVVTLALIVLVTRPSDTSTSPPPRPHTPALPQQTCQWRAAQLLARAGLGGTVALTPDGPLRFEIAYPLAPGQAADEAAQSVWAAFDVALALREQAEQCATFTRVEVTVLAHASQSDAQISASVSAADLAAFGAGELSEDAFIERVTYNVDVMDNARAH